MVTYSGNVSVGGAPDVRELPGLTITKVAVDEQMSNNCYLLRCAETGEQVLIDAAAQSPVLLPLIGDAGLAVVITTHEHWDHHRALADVVGATGARVAAGVLDAAAITEQTGVPVALCVSQGDRITFGEVSLQVIAIAGHTPGSIALLYDDPAAGGNAHLFTGDSLFPGGPGRVPSPEDFDSLMDDLETKVFGVLADSTVVYPGHGNDTTLGAERPHLAEWRARRW